MRKFCMSYVIGKLLLEYIDNTYESMIRRQFNLKIDKGPEKIFHWKRYSNHMKRYSEVLVTACCVLSRFSRVQLFLTSWTLACQGPLSLGFSRWENWSGLPCPSPDDRPDPGREHTILAPPALQAGSCLTDPPGRAWGMQIKTKMRCLIIITYSSIIASDVEKAE